MKTVTINILAEDFKDNNYFNTKSTMEGCPIQRSFIRQGIIEDGQDYQDVIDPESLLDDKVHNMFEGKEPIEDFSMDVEINLPESKQLTEPVIDEP